MKLSREQVNSLRSAVSAAHIKLASLGCVTKVLEEHLEMLMRQHDACNSSSYSSLLDAGDCPLLMHQIVSLV